MKLKIFQNSWDKVSFLSLRICVQVSLSSMLDSQRFGRYTLLQVYYDGLANLHRTPNRTVYLTHVGAEYWLTCEWSETQVDWSRSGHLSQLLEKFEVHMISFQTFFAWKLLLIVHTWNSSPLRSNLLRLQCTCAVQTTSGKPHGSPLVWACQWPSSKPHSSPQLSHNNRLWA